MGIYRASLSGGNNVLPSPWADIKRTDSSVILPDENGNDVGLRIGYAIAPPFEVSTVTPAVAGTGDASWVIAEAAEGCHQQNDTATWVGLKIFAVSGAWAPGDKFNVRCFSAYGTVPSFRTTQWRVNGGADQELVNNDGTDPNTTNDVRFNEVSFDANTEILIEWRRGDTSTNRGSANAVYIEDFAATDTTAPTFTSAPAVTATTETGHTIGATLDEAGTIYGVRLANGATAPTSAQVKAGQDSTGSAAPEAKSAAAANSASLTFSTGSASTAYDYYIVAEDDEATPNLQASPTLVNATTSATAVPGISALTVQKDGAAVQASDWAINITLVSGGTEVYSGSTIASDASGVISAINTTGGSVGDPVRVEGYSAANNYGFVFTQNLENNA